MIKPSYPWPTPPPTTNSIGFRVEASLCHNCGSEEETLGVGSWLADDYSKFERNKLVLCKTCFEKLNNQMIGKSPKNIWAKLKVLLVGEVE